MTTERCGVDATLHRREPLLELPADRQPGRGEQPGHPIEDPQLLTDAPPYGSASTRIVRSSRWARWAASPVATVVRPGAPAGPQTAITGPARPDPLGPRSGHRRRRSWARDQRRSRHRGGRRDRRRRNQRGDADPGGAQPAASSCAPPGAIATGRTPCGAGGRRRRRSRPGSVEAEHRHVAPGPAVAAASRSSTSTQRLSTTMPGGRPAISPGRGTPRRRPRRPRAPRSLEGVHSRAAVRRRSGVPTESRGGGGSRVGRPPARERGEHAGGRGRGRNGVLGSGRARSPRDLGERQPGAPRARRAAPRRRCRDEDVDHRAHVRDRRAGHPGRAPGSETCSRVGVGRGSARAAAGNSSPAPTPRDSVADGWKRSSVRK